MTLWTSPTITFGHANFPVLSPKLQTHCGPIRKALKECEDGDKPTETKSKTMPKDVDASPDACSSPARKDEEVNRLRHDLKICEKTVRKAYRDINIGGCPFEIKSLSLCENEWCHGSASQSLLPSSSAFCQTECAGVKEKLENCIEQHIQQYFRRAGLNQDGTTEAIDDNLVRKWKNG
jgi:hypothetical protein